MARFMDDGPSTETKKARPATVILVVGLLACVLLAVLQTPIDRAGHNSLIVVLVIAAFVSGFIAVELGGGTGDISATFIVGMIAAALLGPASACGVAVIGEVAATIRTKPRRYAVASNLLAAMASALVSANLIRLLASNGPSQTFGFYVTVAVAGSVGLVISFVIAATYTYVLNQRLDLTFATLRALAPSLLLTLVLAVAGVGIYLKLGLAGIAFALTAIFAFSYMAQLVERARRRSEQYVSLSWGVLAGLMRSMDIRDGRIARHSAAVARFARDIAAQVGMSEAEQELAHTAGLLHDIGHFALSDRVAERGRTLTDEDWVAIHRHPELGADMLKDLGMYGPVAEIVLAHHERIDGRGYPNELTEDEIPEIAKIISVAEVYDTLTASDTYRTRMSSFEALTELRRVSRSQLDGRYVEVLAGLLTGVGVDYRHADTADFDTELDMERRINEAGAGR
ncbi:MAG TPA: HD domain-containing phosphohydrolase [Solirubrobacteraceae bacterium]|jgi:putative nucleotidyltransferase with HDIG domain